MTRPRPKLFVCCPLGPPQAVLSEYRDTSYKALQHAASLPAGKYLNKLVAYAKVIGSCESQRRTRLHNTELIRDLLQNQATFFVSRVVHNPPRW